VTSQPPPAPGEGKSAGQFLRPLRDLAAYALVGAPAVFLLVALIRLIPGSGEDYSLRTQDAFYGFVNIETVFFPLAAVLLALLVQPRHPKAQLIVMAAVVEYAVAAVFGVFFGLLLGVIDHASNNGARTAFEELLVRLAWLGLLALTGYAAFQIWRGMFHVPRPQQQPGVYGQPPRYSPAAYPGQPGFGQPPHPGQPGFGQPPHPGQPGFGQPPHPGQPYPGQAPHPGQPHQGYAPPPGYPPQYPAPQSGPPAAAAPQSAPPAPPAGFGPGVYGQPQPPQPPSWNQPPVTIPATTHAEPTQVVPPTESEPPAAETATIEEPQESPGRPGFGPAEPDPPRH
jgi:hypothetical protein